MNLYTLPEHQEYTLDAMHTATTALPIFHGSYGSYPYSELDIVSLPMDALGIEYPGVIGISQDLFSGSQSVDRVRSTVAHEVGHQWFYNLVGNDQSNEPWLDEATASHSVWMYYVNSLGYGQSALDIENYWNGCVQQTETQDVPIGMPAGEYATSREYAGAVYCRGALFLLTLGNQMGQEKFETFIKAYNEKYRWQISTTADFKAVAEETCQCDLTQLFDDWVYPNE